MNKFLDSEREKLKTRVNISHAEWNRPFAQDDFLCDFSFMKSTYPWGVGDFMKEKARKKARILVEMKLRKGSNNIGIWNI